MVGVAATGAPSALCGVFVVLKTMYALGVVLPQYEPATAPRWLSNLMNRVPTVTDARPAERFEDYWVKESAEEAERRRRNDEPVNRPDSRGRVVP